MKMNAKQLMLDILEAYEELGRWWVDEVEFSGNYTENEKQDMLKHWQGVRKWCNDFLSRIKSGNANFTKKDAEMWSDMCMDSNFCSGVMQDYLYDTLERDKQDIINAENLLDDTNKNVKHYLNALKELDTHVDTGEQQDVTEI